ncbi:MAG: tyrosine-protein phosphatase [Gammaproteobacteria bacterium]|nr:tyrosine-protein phosphatase [Gammaproteobacteria bacterium]
MGDRNELPALLHCRTGKDRTRWTAAAFPTSMGVSKDQAMADYLQDWASTSRTLTG